MTIDAPDDRELVSRANEGDADAFETLYRRHRDWVVALAWRLTGSRDDAFDVLQDAFAHLFGRFPGFRLTSSMRAYLYPVVRHTCVSLARKRARVVSLDRSAEPVDPAAALPDPADWSDAFEERIRGLSEGHREVLRLRFVLEMRLDEIAEALELPVGTVKSRLHNALKSLGSAEIGAGV